MDDSECSSSSSSHHFESEQEHWLHDRIPQAQDTDTEDTSAQLQPLRSNDNPHGALTTRSIIDDDSAMIGWTGERLKQSSYKDLGSPIDVEDRFYRHCLTISNTRLALQRLLLQPFSRTTRDYSIEIRAYDFLHQDSVLGDLLLRYPATLLPLLEKAVVRAQTDLLKQMHTKCPESQGGNDDMDPDMVASWTSASVKGGQQGNGAGASATRVHARLVHLPPSRFKASLSRLEARDVGQMWQVSGTVVRASPVQMYESARTYQCRPTKSKKKNSGGGGSGGACGCGRTFVVHANLEHYNNSLTPPDACPLMLNLGCNKRQPCRGTNLVAMDPATGSVHTDYQEIKIQESSSTVGSRIGHIPRSLLVKLEHDLVDLCQPGDQVVLVGSLLAQWQSDVAINTKNAPKNIRDSAEPDIGLALLAHSILVLSDERSSTTISTTSNGLMANMDENKRYSAEFERYWQEEAHRPIYARDYICRAVCPKLYGLPVIKLALLLTLIGGVSDESYTDRNNEHADESKNKWSSVSYHEEEVAEGNDGLNLFIVPQGSQRCTVSQETGYCPNDGRQIERQGLGSATAISTQAQSDSNARQHRSDSPEASSNLHDARLPNHASSAQVYTRRRSQSHLLLVGDPGTGKSQFLRFAAALSPRSVLTTGVGTTSAGLTCAAVRHGGSGEFALEAGALVLADQGVCCIDEFGCIRDQDRTTIHEAMEQQHLSVAKAGIVCKLNCRATIFAVMNPRDCLYDNQCSLSVNTGLGTPLLSRFDLIFKLVDSSDVTRDDNITTYLLNQAIQGPGSAVPLSGPDGNCMSSFSPEPWPIEKLRAYIAIVKEKIFPVLSDEAALLLERHYEACRASQSRTIPLTVRFLESLIRLSQAHARLLYRSNVSLLDAVAVIRVMECSAFCYGGFDCPSSYGYDDNESMHHQSLYRDPMSIDFSNEPDLELCCFEFNILKRYQMLGCMTESRRRLAEDVLHGTSMQSQHAQSWADIEGNHGSVSIDPLITQQWGAYSYPGDAMNQSPNSQGQDQRSRTALTEVQDHYGRTHYSQFIQEPATQRKAKRKKPT